MPFIAGNNGVRIVWHDAAEGYQIQAGEISFDHSPSSADLTATFPNFATALAASMVPAASAMPLDNGLLLDLLVLAIAAAVPALHTALDNHPALLAQINARLSARGLSTIT